VASPGLVSPVHAAGTSAGSAILFGGNGGGSDTADLPGDIVASMTSVQGDDTRVVTSPGILSDTVSAIFGDTVRQLSSGFAGAFPGETAWIDLHVANKGNTTDTILFDSSAPSFDLSGSAGNLVAVSFWNSSGTAPIPNVVLPAEGAAAFKVAVFLDPSAPQGDTLRLTLTLKARAGAGGDPGGYLGNNADSYAGDGDGYVSLAAVSSRASESSATRVAFLSESHLLADDTSSQISITVIVRNETGIVVPNAQVNFSVTHPASGNDLGLSVTSGQTDGSGRVTSVASLSGASASSFYRIKAEVPATGARQNFYAYSSRLNIPGKDTTAANLGKGWRMWSPNRTPSPSSVSGVFHDDLGSNVSVYEWQASSADNSSLNNKKYFAPPSVQRGRAYWVKDIEGGVLDVDGPTPDTSVTVAVTLTKGWNMVGSGQFFFVDWATGVRFRPPGDTETLLTPQGAKDSGLIKNAIYWWDESISNYHFGPDTAVFPSVQMKPMAGFWLYAETDNVEFQVLPKAAIPVDSAAILNQAPSYNGGARAGMLSGYYQSHALTGSVQSWAIQITAQSNGVSDLQNYVGVLPTAAAASQSSLYEPPAVSSGFLTLGVRDPDVSAGISALQAAAYAPPITTAKAWKVEVYSDLAAPVTVAWDNVANLPDNFVAYLATPSGAIDLRKSPSVILPAESFVNHSSVLTLAVGFSEFVSGLLAAPLSKEHSFVYPNPGPDASTGLIYFKHNVISGTVKLRIFDMGGRMVKELSGSASPIPWDTTNRSGQKVGSGVYLYQLESDGSKLTDKLAVVR